MRRLLPPVVILVVTASACGGGPVPTSSPSPRPGQETPEILTGSPPAEPIPSPTADAVVLPQGLPSEFPDPLPASEVPTEALVPEGAQVTGTWYVPAAAGIGEEIVVAWASGADPFQREHGLAVWQAFADAPPWRPVFGFLDRAARGVLGIRVQLGDLTADGHEDVLSFEDTGGSGACGIWRVLATRDGTMSQLYRRQTCDTDIVSVNGTLIMTEAVYEPDDAHCCPSATRTTTLQWDGAIWSVVDEVVAEI